MVDEFYREEILDHCFSSAQRGRLAAPDLAADGSNPLCGDRLRIELALDPEGRIGVARFDGQGCAISQAAASMLTEEIEGKSMAEARAMSRDDMLGLLQIPLTPARQKCGLLAWKTLQKALDSAPLPAGSVEPVPGPVCPGH